MTIPTKLIILRVALIPVFLALFFIGAETARWAALAVFAIASITDFFDGRIARRRDQVTNFYTFGDPLADKLLICSALIALVSTQSIPAWFAILIVCRDFIITGLRLVAATQNIVAGAVITGKANTMLQMILIVLILAGVTGTLITILIWIIVALVIVSTAENFIKNKQVIKCLFS